MSAWRSPGWMSAVCGRASQEVIRARGAGRLQRVGGEPRVGGDPHEAEDRRPAQPDRAGPVHQPLPPAPRRVVPARARIVGVHQQVDAGDDHCPSLRTRRSAPISPAIRSSRSVSMPGLKPNGWGSTR